MSNDYGDQLHKMNHAVADAIEGDERPRVYYSAYKTSKTTGMPLNNLNSIAVRGLVIFVEQKDEFWADGEASDYKSKVVDNPTWLDVAVLADAMIHTVRDFHHIFLEGVAPSHKKINDVKVYEFIMGS